MAAENSQLDLSVSFFDRFACWRKHYAAEKPMSYCVSSAAVHETGEKLKELCYLLIMLRRAVSSLLYGEVADSGSKIRRSLRPRRSLGHNSRER